MNLDKIQQGHYVQLDGSRAWFKVKRFDLYLRYGLGMICLEGDISKGKNHILGCDFYRSIGAITGHKKLKEVRG